MKALRAYFLNRHPRERILVMSFLAASALVWLFSFGGRALRFWNAYSRDSRTIASNTAVINSRADVEARSRAAVEVLDPARTYNQANLFSEVSNMANSAGFRNRNIAYGTDIPGEQYSVHSVGLQVSGITDWEAINRFYLLLNEKRPYINLRNFTMRVVGTPPSITYTLNAQIASVERQRVAQ